MSQPSIPFLIAISLAVVISVGCQSSDPPSKAAVRKTPAGLKVTDTAKGNDRAATDYRASYETAEMVEALSALRNDINARYGFRDLAPRINLGPCGRFARDFRERWNSRFRDPVTITFIMANNDASNCYHVLIKLPDGRYFDGGNGVMTEAFVAKM
jgi:hypothetical protein